MLKVGVIGCGAMGQVHARHLHSKVAGACVTAIMDTRTNVREVMARECGSCLAGADAAALIAHADVDAVVIASPDDTHAELVLQCIAAGKPVLCEKPVATTEADARRILDAETTVGRRLLQVGFMREYDEAHLQLQRALCNPALGRRLMFRSRAVNPAKDTERPVDEVITNSAIHEIHSARWLMGQEIERVFVQHVPYHLDNPGSCRLMSLSLHFNDGGLGTILINSEGGYGHEVEIEVTTERGQVNTGRVLAPVLRFGSAQTEQIPPSWRERFASAYLNEITDWVEAVSAGAPTGPDAWDGYRSLVVCDACKRSVRTGQAEEVAQAPKPRLYTASEVD